MKKFIGSVVVGLRDKDTMELIKAYPTELEGDDSEIEKKVKDWYYQLDCANEDLLRNYFVDNLNESELKNYEGEKK